MLNKKDLKAIADLFELKFDENIKPALTEFFDTLILTYFENNEKDHAEIRASLKSHDNRFDDLDKRFDSHDKDIDSIQRKLEKSEDDHEEIFDKLEEIDQHAQSQEKRIKKLEVSSGLNN